MKTERQIAELIFDQFRKANCRSGQIVMMRSIQFGIIDKLNPKEKDLFFTVFNGLILTGYYTYESGSPECIRLTDKGYDFIYDDTKTNALIHKSWVIPSTNNTDWEKAYYKLWKAIGPQDSAPHYIKGSAFYSFIMDFCDDIPPSYGKYIEQRRDKELSTSRVDYYSDLINHLDEEKRMELYIKIQLFIEDEEVTSVSETNEFQIEPNPFDEKEPVTIESVKEIKITEMEDAPTVFISYSWDDEEHEEWVLKLATKLCDNGVNAILDKWDLGELGKPLPHFMENSIANSQRVICIMTPNYKKKTDNLKGGVGFEYSIITSQIFNDLKTSKFIPLFRNGTDADAIPAALAGRKYVDMRSDAEFEDKFLNELLRDIFNEPKHKKPTIGKKPTFD